MIEKRHILIVEDEMMIALDIIDVVEAGGAIVVGPFPTVAEALETIGSTRIDAAILDGNLADRDITPVALRLLADEVPMIVYSGVGLPHELADAQPDIPVIFKPSPVAEIVAMLGKMLP